MRGEIGNYQKKIDKSHLNQLKVLKAMFIASAPDFENSPVDISHIASLSGVNDEDDVQRCLFILEGQRLVCPYPKGNFTSKQWLLTKEGVKVVQLAKVHGRV
ncbi:MAG: hypothetical protein D6780_08705 [Candidatus Dadabacteria bacterium]|nr:MAG: hypothetical protein D6780_08705 [Candidatus Dadabacteria bacterium]